MWIVCGGFLGQHLVYIQYGGRVPLIFQHDCLKAEMMVRQSESPKLHDDWKCTCFRNISLQFIFTRRAFLSKLFAFFSESLSFFFVFYVFYVVLQSGNSEWIWKKNKLVLFYNHLPKSKTDLTVWKYWLLAEVVFFSWRNLDHSYTLRMSWRNHRFFLKIPFHILVLQSTVGNKKHQLKNKKNSIFWIFRWHTNKLQRAGWFWIIYHLLLNNSTNDSTHSEKILFEKLKSFTDYAGKKVKEMMAHRKRYLNNAQNRSLSWTTRFK